MGNSDYKRIPERKITEFEICNLSGYINAVEVIHADWKNQRQIDPKANDELFPGELIPWFRGNTRWTHEPEPALLRKNIFGDGDDDGLAEAVKKIMDNHKGEPVKAIKKIEGYMLRRFATAGIQFVKSNISSPKEPDADIEWMMLMQHNGVPTRLLDWSKSALIALYYAIKKFSKREKEMLEKKGSSVDIDSLASCVWVLAPRSLQEKCRGTRKLCTEFDAEVKPYLKLEVEEELEKDFIALVDKSCNEVDAKEGYSQGLAPSLWREKELTKDRIRTISMPVHLKQESINQIYFEKRKKPYPLPIIPSHVHERIIAQQARFTLHTHEPGMLTKFALEYEGSGFSPLVKIKIPLACQKDIFRNLRLMGITEQEIMPNLDSIAIEIKQRLILGEE